MSLARRPSWAWPAVGFNRVGRASARACVVSPRPARAPHASAASDVPNGGRRLFRPPFRRSRRAGERGSTSCRSSADRRRQPSTPPRISAPRRQASPSGRSDCSKSSPGCSAPECPPTASGAQPPIDAVERRAIVAGRAARLVGRQRRDDRLIEIGKVVAARRHVRPANEHESSRTRKRNPFL